MSLARTLTALAVGLTFAAAAAAQINVGVTLSATGPNLLANPAVKEAYLGG